MKYIDADILSERIKKNQYVIEPMFLKGDDSYYEGENDGYNRILDIIDSLQQEQPDADLDADIEMEWNSFKKHLAEYGEESEEVIWLNYNSFKDVAQSFFNRGLLSK